MDFISKKQRASSYIYKSKKLRNVYTYKKPETLQKTRQFASRFYIQKDKHFTLRNFLWILQVGIYIQNAWNFVLSEILYTKT